MSHKKISRGSQDMRLRDTAREAWTASEQDRALV